MACGVRVMRLRHGPHMMDLCLIGPACASLSAKPEPALPECGGNLCVETSGTCLRHLN